MGNDDILDVDPITYEGEEPRRKNKGVEHDLGDGPIDEEFDPEE